MTGSSEPPEVVRPPDVVTPPEAATPSGADAPPEGADPEPGSRERRPMIERIGLALIALVIAVLFGVVSVASWVGGELFLAVMAGVGCLMTVWVGTLTLVRG